MAKEYIEREALIQNMQECKGDSAFNIMATGYAYSFIKSAPAADVVEVVRCKDCRYGNPYLHYFYCDNNNAPWSENTMANIMDANDFCSYGERKCEDG